MVASAVLLASCAAEETQDEGAGSALTLPTGVVVDQGFERDEMGMAVDPDSAQVRFEGCMRDSGYPLDDPEVESYLADREKGRDEVDWDLERVLTTCSQAAGTGWGPGNRPDEVAALNEAALNQTECVRERGWEVPDPVPEPFDRFLRFDAETVFEMVPDDAESARQFIADVEECFNRYAIDWDAWRRENPRN